MHAAFSSPRPGCLVNRYPPTFSEHAPLETLGNIVSLFTTHPPLNPFPPPPARVFSNPAGTFRPVPGFSCRDCRFVEYYKTMCPGYELPRTFGFYFFNSITGFFCPFLYSFGMSNSVSVTVCVLLIFLSVSPLSLSSPPACGKHVQIPIVDPVLRFSTPPPFMSSTRDSVVNTGSLFSL